MSNWSWHSGWHSGWCSGWRSRWHSRWHSGIHSVLGSKWLQTITVWLLTMSHWYSGWYSGWHSGSGSLWLAQALTLIRFFRAWLWSKTTCILFFSLFNWHVFHCVLSYCLFYERFVCITVLDIDTVWMFHGCWVNWVKMRPSFVQLSPGEMGRGKEGKIGFRSSMVWSGKEGAIGFICYITLNWN